MIFSLFFEISLVVLGLLYIGNMYLDSFIHFIEVSKSMDNDEKEKEEDKQRAELTRHFYS